jgi:predicted GIY-YIG superfamily endonuclease
MHYCYIALCADDSYYVGLAEDPEDRIAEHNSGKGADWTAARLPVRLVWSEPHPTLKAARRREIQLKGWSRAKKAALIAGSLRFGASQKLTLLAAPPQDRQLPPPPPKPQPLAFGVVFLLFPLCSFVPFVVQRLFSFFQLLRCAWPVFTQ